MSVLCMAAFPLFIKKNHHYFGTKHCLETCKHITSLFSDHLISALSLYYPLLRWECEEILGVRQSAGQMDGWWDV